MVSLVTLARLFGNIYTFYFVVVRNWVSKKLVLGYPENLETLTTEHLQVKKLSSFLHL